MQTSETTKTTSVISDKRQQVVDRRGGLLRRFTESAERNHQKRMARLFREVSQANDFIATLDRIEQEMRPKPIGGGNRYAISSLFLHECFRELTRDDKEQFFFITGSEIEGVFVLDQRAEFSHEKRTMMGVTADPRSTHRLLIKLEQFGHKLLAHFHSHPGMGADATSPSGTDEKFQERLESAGHIAVAAIFSRDGFVRFLRIDQKLEIEIYGEGVEKREDNIFRLTNVS